MFASGFGQCRTLKCLHVFVKYKRKVPFLARTAPTHSVSHFSQTETQRAVKCRWSVLFFGNDNFALESLKNLHREYRLDRLRRLEVVTSSKGNRSAILKFIKENNIVVHMWPLETTVTDFDIGIVVSFGHLIPSDLIYSFPLGMLNVHASLLPRWRGAAPIIYSLMNGDTQTGVTVMKIAPKKFDIGEVLDQQAVDIGPNEAMPELFSKLAIMGANILIRTLNRLPGILSNARPQSTSGITYAPKINKSSISQINWKTMSSKNIYDLHRALTGVCALVGNFEGTALKLLEIYPIEAPTHSVEYQDHVPGSTIYSTSDNVLTIKCKNESWIAVRRIGIPNRRVMNAADFNNGFIIGRKRKYIVLK